MKTNFIFILLYGNHFKAFAQQVRITRISSVKFFRLLPFFTPKIELKCAKSKNYEVKVLNFYKTNDS